LSRLSSSPPQRGATTNDATKKKGTLADLLQSLDEKDGKTKKSTLRSPATVQPMPIMIDDDNDNDIIVESQELGGAIVPSTTPTKPSPTVAGRAVPTTQSTTAISATQISEIGTVMESQAVAPTTTTARRRAVAAKKRASPSSSLSSLRQPRRPLGLGEERSEGSLTQTEPVDMIIVDVDGPIDTKQSKPVPSTTTTPNKAEAKQKIYEIVDNGAMLSLPSQLADLIGADSHLLSTSLHQPVYVIDLPATTLHTNATAVPPVAAAETTSVSVAALAATLPPLPHDFDLDTDSVVGAVETARVEAALFGDNQSRTRPSTISAPPSTTNDAKIAVVNTNNNGDDNNDDDDNNNGMIIDGVRMSRRQVEKHHALEAAENKWRSLQVSKEAASLITKKKTKNGTTRVAKEEPLITSNSVPESTNTRATAATLAAEKSAKTKAIEDAKIVKNAEKERAKESALVAKEPKTERTNKSKGDKSDKSGDESNTGKINDKSDGKAKSKKKDTILRAAVIRDDVQVRSKRKRGATTTTSTSNAAPKRTGSNGRIGGATTTSASPTTTTTTTTKNVTPTRLFRRRGDHAVVARRSPSIGNISSQQSQQQAADTAAMPPPPSPLLDQSPAGNTRNRRRSLSGAGSFGGSPFSFPSPDDIRAAIESQPPLPPPALDISSPKKRATNKRSRTVKNDR
jgi:hypothetical protein